MSRKLKPKRKNKIKRRNVKQLKQVTNMNWEDLNETLLGGQYEIQKTAKNRR